MVSKIKGITIEIDGNTTKLDKALQSTNRELKDIQSDLKAVERGLKMDPGNVELVAQKQRLLSEAAETSKRKLDDLTKAADGMNQALADGKIDQKQFDAFNVELALAETNYNAAERAAGGFNETAGEIDSVADKVSSSGGKIAAFAQEVGDKLSSVGDKIAAFAQKVGTALAAAIAATTGAAVAIAKKSLETGMEFDSAMSQVAATMGTTVDEIGELRDFALEMGSKTAFSATEAAEALNYMALAGYDSAKAMEMLPNVLNLAAAGNIDLASASDMVTDAQSALGLSMEETAQLVDKMAMASSKSNTSVAQLGQAFLTVGGTAKSLAGGTTELSTALGILADNGIKGAEGGTALRNVILSLSAPTDKAKEALSSLGVQAYDASGNMRPLNDTLNDLFWSMSYMSQEGKTEILNTIFNKNDLKAVEALLANTGARWYELAGAIDAADGAAQRMADTQLDNLAGDITLFNSALESAQITLSDQLTPSMRGFVQFGTASIGELTDAFKENGVSGAMDALGTILSDGIAMVTDMLPDMLEAGMGLLGALAQGIMSNLPTLGEAALAIVSTLTDGVSEATKAIGTILKDSISILPDMMSDVLDAGTELLSSLVGGIMSNLPTLGEAALVIVSTLTDGVLTGLSEIGQQLFDVLLKAIKEGIPAIADTALEIAKSLGQGLDKGIPQLLDVFSTLLSVLVYQIIENLPKFVEAGYTILHGLLDGFMASLPSLLYSITYLIEEITGLISKNLPEIVSMGIEFVTALAGAIIDAIPIILASLPNLILAIVDGLMDLLGAFTEVGKNIIAQILHGIMDAAQRLKATITEFFTDALPQMVQNGLTWLSELPERVAYGVGQAVGSVIGFFRGLVTSAIETFPLVVESISTFFAELPDRVMSFFNDTIKNIIQWGADVILWAQKTIPAIVKSILSFFAELPREMVEVGKNIIKGLLDGIMSAFMSLIESVNKLINSFVQGVKDALGIHSPSRVFADIGENMALGLGKGWSDEFSAIKRDIADSMNFNAGNIVMGVSSKAQTIDIAETSQRSNSFDMGVSSGWNPKINIIFSGELAPLARQFRTLIQVEDARLGPSLEQT